MDFQSVALERAQLEKKAIKLTRIIYKDESVKLREHTLKLKEGDLTHAVIDHKDAVGIVPVEENGNVILVRQWRRAIERITIEIPAGTIESGETPETAAKRELTEEIHFFPEKLSYLYGFYPAPGFCTEYLHLFVAENLRIEKKERDKDEAIDVLSVSLKEALFMIENQIIIDAKTIIGLTSLRKVRPCESSI